MPTQDTHLGLQAGSKSISQKQARETSAKVVSSYGLNSSTHRLESAHKIWNQGVLDLCAYTTYQNTKMHMLSQCKISHQNINKHTSYLKRWDKKNILHQTYLWRQLRTTIIFYHRLAISLAWGAQCRRDAMKDKITQLKIYVQIFYLRGRKWLW